MFRCFSKIQSVLGKVQKSRSCLPSTHGRVALSAGKVQKTETEDTPVSMETRQELAHRFRLKDTTRQTLVSRRSDRGRDISRLEVWKLLRELGDMNKSLNTDGSEPAWFRSTRTVYTREQRTLAGQAVAD